AGRDPGGRAVLEARNRLLTAWLRRSPRVAAATTASALRSPSGRRGLAAALAHLDWVAAARRRVPAALDRQVAAAERGWNDFLAAAAAARPPAGGTGAAGTADAAGGAAAPAEGPSRVAVSPTRAG
ncbi:MAG TPA: hypothetical protein VFY17_06780, partial [Pilimelia sp.]|nr:hypothetical protein [Pilimelia sp.]